MFGRDLSDFSPARSKKSVQTLISATKTLISRNKQTRLNCQKTFVEVFTNYLTKVMTVLTKSDNNLFMDASFDYSLKFLTLGRSSLISDD